MKLSRLFWLMLPLTLAAQSPAPRSGPGAEPAPTQGPPAQAFQDTRYHVSFQTLPGWELEHKDGLLSNFRRDTRGQRLSQEVRGVAALGYNPYPLSTFASALMYFSVTPRSSAASCASQASAPPFRKLEPAQIAGRTFAHGRDTHGNICTEARDEVFTTMVGPSCYRFDLVVNTFCSETTGAQTLRGAQLDDIEQRLNEMLQSVQITTAR